MGITDTVKWRAIYNDNTFLDEQEQNGTEHAFKEIDFTKIQAFQLINQQNIAICQVKLGEGKRLIFARRNLMTTGARTIMQGDVKVSVPAESHRVIIILGWQKTVNEVNSKAIFYLLPDGRIEMDDEWHEDSLHSAVNTPSF